MTLSFYMAVRAEPKTKISLQDLNLIGLQCTNFPFPCIYCHLLPFKFIGVVFPHVNVFCYRCPCVYFGNHRWSFICFQFSARHFLMIHFYYMPADKPLPYFVWCWGQSFGRYMEAMEKCPQCRINSGPHALKWNKFWGGLPNKYELIRNLVGTWIAFVHFRFLIWKTLH
jgi:hypothetical protein